MIDFPRNYLGPIGGGEMVPVPEPEPVPVDNSFSSSTDESVNITVITPEPAAPSETDTNIAADIASIITLINDLHEMASAIQTQLGEVATTVAGLATHEAGEDHPAGPTTSVTQPEPASPSKSTPEMEPERPPRRGHTLNRRLW